MKLFKSALVFASVFAGSIAASADELSDLALAQVQVVAVAGTSAYDVTVDVDLVPDFVAPSQPILVRLYCNGIAFTEYATSAGGLPSGTCCADVDTCPADNDHWTARCDRTCPSGGNATPRECIYRNRVTTHSLPLPTGGVLVAVVDPDGWHQETGIEGTSNNTATALVPPPSLCLDLALEQLQITELDTSGLYTATIDVAVRVGANPLTAPLVVRLYDGAMPIAETQFAGPGIGGKCCIYDSECDLDGFSNTCEGTCAQSDPSRGVCTHRVAIAIAPAALMPGATVTAVIDPDHLHNEECAPGTSNNAVTFVVPQSATAYCVGKPNSVGCVPSVTFVGSASATSPNAFVIAARLVLPGRNGLLFYGHGQQALPFVGGTLCVQTPLTRTPLQVSSGDASAFDCAGAFAYDFNARIRSGVDPTLTPGANVAAQYWYRDAAASFGLGLSNALWFQVGN